MNANELADYLLDHMHDGGMTDLVMGEAATMLRQQQAEIEALKKNLDVALMIVNEPAKTLTDEEIWACHDSTDSDNWVIDFARAILRKAQEK